MSRRKQRNPKSILSSGEEELKREPHEDSDEDSRDLRYSELKREPHEDSDEDSRDLRYSEFKREPHEDRDEDSSLLL